MEPRRSGAWILLHGSLNVLPALLRLDHALKEEAEMVLRWAADLADDANLPDAAYKLMKLCEFVV